MPDFLFVYGTLRKGSAHPMAERLALAGKYVGPAHVLGDLYDLGWHLGLVPSQATANRVLGDVFDILPDHATELWRVLDEYEGCAPDVPEPRLFKRDRLQAWTRDGVGFDAWAYVPVKPPVAARLIPGGDFLRSRPDRS